MIQAVRNLYLTPYFFLAYGAVVALFVASFLLPPLFPVAQTALVLVTVVISVEAILLYRQKTPLEGKRLTPNVFSLSDENPITIKLISKAYYDLNLRIIDELPFQIQDRHFNMTVKLEPLEEVSLPYTLRPLSRGEYSFGDINLYIKGLTGVMERRVVLKAAKTFPVYPSFIQMKQFELQAFTQTTQTGIKKTRKIGHSYEFEQIKSYVRGDDFRSINWKATSRRGDLMVNQYQDEREQQVYSIIDKSRSMKMPFDGLSLLDYAINSTLVLSNIILLKQDKAGLITFSDKLGTIIKADRKRRQINLINQALYKQKERPLEANYEVLYMASKSFVRNRSLIFLYTNFESLYAAERALPLLRRINRQHLLVTIFFKNTELDNYIEKDATRVSDIYDQTIARKFMYEKEQIAIEFSRYGIQSILTRPQDLNVNTVNKYLELKARGLI